MSRSYSLRAWLREHGCGARVCRSFRLPGSREKSCAAPESFPREIHPFIVWNEAQEEDHARTRRRKNRAGFFTAAARGRELLARRGAAARPGAAGLLQNG